MRKVTSVILCAALLAAVGITHADQTSNAVVRAVVVASPRASLIGLPARPSTDEAEDADADRPGRRPAMVEVYNFARTDGRILARTNTVLNVRLAPDTEGVWYENAAGSALIVLGVDIFVPSNDALGAADPDGRWVRVGHDWAFRHDVGPKIAHARRVCVPVHPLPVGDHLLRARVWSMAHARHASQDTTLSRRHIDVDFDKVLLHVRVADPATDESAAWERLPQAIEEVDMD